MHAALFTSRHAAPSAAAASAAHASLQIQDVLAHVARRHAHQAPDLRLQHLLDAVDACAHMVAARRVMAQVLDVQQRIERLDELARGRERVLGLSAEASRALATHTAGARDRAACALAHWRRVSQAFAQRTGLLPTQLPHDAAWPPTPTAAQQQAWNQALGPNASASAQILWERTQQRWRAAQGRCESVRAGVRAATGKRIAAHRSQRIGQGSLSGLARAWLNELDARGEWLWLEAECAAAQCALGLLRAHTGCLR